MRKILGIAAFAACVNVVAFAGGIVSVDWSSVSGKLTIPADTTNEVLTAADFTYFTNRITQVKFGNENSTLRFAVSTYPNNMPFEDWGTVLMSEKVFLSTNTTLKHVNGSVTKGKFLRFVFEKGLDSDDGATLRTLSVNPDGVCFYNAVVSIRGPVAHVKPDFLNASRVDIGENAYLATTNCTIGYNARIAMIRQRGGVVFKNSSTIAVRHDTKIALHIEGGVFTNAHDSTDFQRIYMRANYMNFRQTGGLFNLSRSWVREDAKNSVEGAAPISSDYVFGGTAAATNSFFEYYGPLNFVVMDDAHVSAGTLATDGDTFGKYRHIVACNGGVLSANIAGQSRNTYFAFNGGRRVRTEWNGIRMFGDTSRENNPIWVRIYENGGTIDNTDRDSFNLPSLKAPVGNVVKSIAMSEELANMVFQTPPAVEIMDASGAGSNAVALVDYDFDSGKVTNITIACRGENYSGAAGDVTANLRYKDGEALLSTPLACSVGTCSGGDVTFAGMTDHTINSGNTTNTYCGLTIIDMDTTHAYDHTAASVSVGSFCINTGNLADNPQYASTGLVVRSGCFGRDYINSYRPNITNYFHSLERLELRGGYFFGFLVDSVKDVVVGGETWLERPYEGSTDSLTSPYFPILTVPADGTLTVDAACLASGVTPTLKYGKEVNFAEGAKITVKNWAVDPSGARQTLLDLSEVTTVNGTPTVEYPEGAAAKITLKWDAAEKKLYGYWKRGFIMTVR